MRAARGWGAIAAVLVALLPAAGPAAAAGSVVPPWQAGQSQLERGRSLYLDGCSSCHGFPQPDGVEGLAPSLVGVGAQAADFYLRTGRMPLADPGQQPKRGDPAYPPEDIDAIVAYIASLGGPAVPEVNPQRGDLAEGMQLFGRYCMQCHQIVGQGGVVVGAVAPPLTEATPTQVAEAIRIGPYLMPNFPETVLSDDQVDSIARYVAYTQDPQDEGGWALGHIGPVAEGMVTFLIALAAVVIAIRLIGKRTTA